MTDAISYTPTPSVAGFLLSEAFVSLILGPIGSTKTTASIMKIVYHAKQMAPCRDGIRRSRAVWVRNTREQLRDTSIPDFLQWFPDGLAGTYMKTDYNFLLRFDDVECLVMFRGLDDTNDVRRLLSLQLSFGILDEFREINPAIVDAIQGRLGRYPSKAINVVGCVTDTGKSNAHLWGASNPPDMGTWWEEQLSSPPTNWDPFFQPSGLSQDADWRQFLPADYYENLAEGKSQDWIDVYIHAKFGKSLAGRAVFTGFRSDYHVAKAPLTLIKSTDKPLIIGFDFGLNPSATINQIDYHGRLLTYVALTSSGMGLTRFIETVLQPVLAQRFQGMPVCVVGDPAGKQRAQTDEKTCFDILRGKGFPTYGASTNATAARIAAVDSYLSRQIEGGPAWLIDPDCKPLIQALRGGYRYKAKRNGEFDPTPEKNDASHIADAMQYACLHAHGGMDSSLLEQPRREVVTAPALGWT